MIGRAKQPSRARMACGIRRHFGSRVEGADGLAPSTSTANPDSNPYCAQEFQSGVTSTSISARPQTLNHNLASFGVSVLGPRSNSHTAWQRWRRIDAEGIHKVNGAQYARENGLPSPSGNRPTLIAIEAHGISQCLHTNKPGNSGTGSQACS